MPADPLALGMGPENIRSETGLNFPWKEYTGRVAWAGDISFAVDRSTATSAMIVNGEDLNEVYPQLCGYSKRIGSGPLLFRQLPMRHPRFPWLYCAAVVKTEGWTPEDEANTDVLGKNTLNYANYRFYKLTLQFNAPSYDVGANGADEWTRFTTRRREPSAEYITRQKGAFVYGEGSFGVDGQYFKGSVGQLVAKVRLRWMWWMLPEQGLMNGNQIPVNIENAIGKVNAYDFAGYKAGTLLMEAPKYTDCDLPVRPLLIKTKSLLTENNGSPFILNPDQIDLLTAPRAWNVEFSILRFNPPTNGSVYGHNLVPHPTNGLWYLAHSATPAFTVGNAQLVNGSNSLQVNSTAGIATGSVVKPTARASQILADAVARLTGRTDIPVPPIPGAGALPKDTFIVAAPNSTTLTLSNPANFSTPQGIELGIYPVTYPLYDFKTMFQMCDDSMTVQ